MALEKEKAEKYYYLARAALCEVPVMDDTSFDAVNALVSRSPLDSDVFGLSRAHIVLHGMVSVDVLRQQEGP